jgi:uncharacterized protein YhaN
VLKTYQPGAIGWRPARLRWVLWQFIDRAEYQAKNDEQGLRDYENKCMGGEAGVEALRRELLTLLEEEIAALTVIKSELDQTIGEERNELKKMDGRAEAAEVAQDIQLCLGELGGLVRSFSRLKIASMVLSDAMEKYRGKSQGPVLKRASEYFSSMTLGSFEALRVDTDEKENSVVAGLRAGGEVVKVDGLSDGTADQLYLSLRLASLEHYLDSNEPLPFIVDDILVRFDDERAAATLEIMAMLSERTQVIFFTHHAHLVETAKSAVGLDRLFIHEIGT